MSAGLEELVRLEVDRQLAERLGEARIAIPLLAEQVGVSGDALRMRCRRMGITTSREGKVATVALADVPQLLRAAEDS